MDQFLNQETTEGALDSEGVFTIDTARAVAKQASYSFPLGEWALKLIQGASLAGAKAIKVSLSRKEANFDFGENTRYLEHPGDPDTNVIASWTTKDGLWDPEDVVSELLLQQRDEVAQDLKDFVAGILGSGFDYRLNLQGSESDLVWDGTVLQQSPRSRFDRHTAISLKLEHKDQRAMVHTLLSKRAYGSSCELKLGGRRIDNLRNASRDSADVLFAGGWLTDTGKELVRLDPNIQLRGSRIVRTGPVELGAKVHWNSHTLQSRTAKIFFLLWARPRKASEPIESVLIFLRGGIEVAREPLRIKANGVFTTVFVSADHLKTDLTGLKLVESSQLEQVRVRAKQRLATTDPLPRIVITDSSKELTASLWESIGMSIGFQMRDWEELERDLNRQIGWLEGKLQGLGVSRA